VFEAACPAAACPVIEAAYPAAACPVFEAACSEATCAAAEAACAAPTGERDADKGGCAALDVSGVSGSSVPYDSLQVLYIFIYIYIYIYIYICIAKRSFMAA
jgi:hypothetical protein